MDSVMVPEEVFVDPSPLWEDFLIGRFLAKAPHVGKVHAIVNKIWASEKNQMIEVYVINQTSMKFRITNPMMRHRILKRGMWNLAGIPVVMAKWKPFEEDIQQEKQSVPLWVHMRNVPMNMFSWKGLSFMSSPVGVPVRLHPETAQCLDLKVAKNFVNADLTKELPRVMQFTVQGKEIKWGHSSKTCQLKKVEESRPMEEVVVGEQTTNAVKEAHSSEEASNEQEVPIAEPKTANTTPNGVDNAIENIDKETRTPILVADGDGDLSVVKETGTTEEPHEKGWTTVSPDKVGRSAENKRTELEFGKVSILANSRFSVLSLEEEEGEILDLDSKVAEEIMEPAKEQSNVSVTNPLDTTRGDETDKGTQSVSRTKEKEVFQRPSLPRSSKDNHKVLSNSVQKPSVQKAAEVNPSTLNKKSLSRNH
ncbi:hypothetical protein N665_1178s0003 [Sinapis alba]|nr:hypothetical protein N665_1178s0003 [Sinapis alba]